MLTSLGSGLEMISIESNYIEREPGVNHVLDDFRDTGRDTALVQEY